MALKIEKGICGKDISERQLLALQIIQNTEYPDHKVLKMGIVILAVGARKLHLLTIPKQIFFYVLLALLRLSNTPHISCISLLSLHISHSTSAKIACFLSFHPLTKEKDAGLQSLFGRSKQ
jgi:hypothetical protein